VQPNGRFIVNNAPVSDMILMAYQLQPFQLAGAPPGPAAAAANAPSLFTALEEQLGLKLQATSGPVDVLAIDSIERPSEY